MEAQILYGRVTVLKKEIKRLNNQLSTAVAVNESYGHTNRRCLATLEKVATFVKGKAGLSDSDREDIQTLVLQRLRIERVEMEIARERWEALQLTS